MAEGIKLPQLDPTTGLDNSDVVLTTKGSQDYKATLAELVSHIKDNITPAEILTMLLQVDGDNAGINATTLQGLLPSFFRNASNLNSGTVPNSRLPSGDNQLSFVQGGEYNAGRNQLTLNFPNFMLGINLRVIVGWSFFVTTNSNITINFDQPFTQGFGTENTPIVIGVPECRSGVWNGTVSKAFNPENIELDARLWYSDLSKAIFSTMRHGGFGGDRVRVNYMAIGRY